MRREKPRSDSERVSDSVVERSDGDEGERGGTRTKVGCGRGRTVMCRSPGADESGCVRAQEQRRACA